MPSAKKLWGAVVFASLISFALAEPLKIESSEPRPFGYVIGDEIERRLAIELPQDHALVKESLPKPGRADLFLELKSVRVDAERPGRIALTLTYQLMSAPEQVKVLALPPVELKFQRAGQEIEERIGEWLFTAAPITPEQVVARDGLDELRPDRAPRPISTSWSHARLALYALAASALLLYLGYRRLPFRRRQPFAAADREVKRLSRNAGDRASFQAALRAVHRAFDETAGCAVFAEELGVFFARHPRLAAATPAAKRFFALSRREFFGAEAENGLPAWERLIELSRELRKRETKAL